MFQSIKTGVLSAFLVTAALVAHAQKKINEGIITYAAAYELPEDKKAMADMMPKETKIKFNGNMTKIDMEQGPAQIQVIVDQNAKTSLVLIDVPIAQMQFAVKQTKEDYEKQQASSPKFVDFKETGEKQTIAGYNAVKYTYKDDKGSSYEAWATTDVETPRPTTDDPFKAVKGTLLKFTNFQQGVKTTLTVKSITEAKVGALSLEVPSGYELKTMEEIQAMQGGGE